MVAGLCMTSGSSMEEVTLQFQTLLYDMPEFTTEK